MSQSINLLLKKEGRPLALALRTQGERVVAAIFAANEVVSDARPRAPRSVPGNPAPDRWSAAKATNTMLNGSLESCRLTGDVHLGDEKLDQMGL